MWMFKVTQQDCSRRSCNGIPKHFQAMFRDSEVSKKFTMDHHKASYSISDGLGHFVTIRLSKQISASGGAFISLFDEATTSQNCKQTDFLIRF